MALTVGIENRMAGSYVISPNGRLDAVTTPSFEGKIDPLLVPATKAIILNLEKLAYLSSAGVRVIFKIRKALTSRRGTFIMTNVSPSIQKVFDIINALPDTPVFKSVEDADRYLDLMQKKEAKGPQNSPDA